MNYPLVSFLIVNWNGKPHLSNCLTSVFATTYPNKEIILVDNGSHDGSVSYVRQHFPKVKIIENKEDAGFCKANNLAYEKAKGTYLLMLNNDTTVTKNFLEPLVAMMDKDEYVGVVQPKIIFMLSKKLQSGCTYFTYTGFLYYSGFHKDPENQKYNSQAEMYSANGSCMLVRKSVIDTIGFLDEDFFSYFEETDFCHRALLAGYTIMYEPKGVIHHIGSVDNKKEKTYTIQKNAFRNRLTSYLKNLSVSSLLLILPIHSLVCSIYVLFNVLKGRRDYAKAIIDAYVWNIVHIKNTLNKRRTIQKFIRKKSDSEIFRSVVRWPRLAYYYYLTSDLANYLD